MKVYRVRLTPQERAYLEGLLSKGKAAARTLTHARILLKADEGEAGPRLSDEAIAQALDVNRSTVERVRIRGNVRLITAATEAHTFTSAELRPSSLVEWRALRQELNQRQLSRRLQRQFRRDPAAYLAAVERLLHPESLPP